MKYFAHILLLSISLICLVTLAGYGQAIPLTEQQAREELEKRGISEEEVLEALAKEGIQLDHVNNVQDLTPQELQSLQNIINELEVKHLQEKAIPLTPSNIEDNDQETKSSRIDRPDTIKLDSLDFADNLTGLEEDRLIYGQSIFTNGSIQVFQNSADIKLPDNYILGVGDELSVSIFGRSQFEEKYEIRTDGYIRILDGNRRLLLKGSTLGSAKEKLFKAFSNYYSFKSGEFEVALSFQRTVNVGIYGEVKQVGNYQLLAFNNVINALVAAGGPNEIGTLRKIQLLKSEGGVQTIDVYEYMTKPQMSEAYFMEDNDVIHVPVQGNIIRIEGAVKRPMKYELLNSEGLTELLKYAGGLKEDAYRKTFAVFRFVDDELVKLDIPYADLISQNQSFNLFDGDRVVVESIDSELRKFVNVQGEVVNEGEFERRANMRVSDLIQLAGLRTESYTAKALIVRTNNDSTKSFKWINIENILANPASPDNFLLRDRDNLTIWDRARFTDQKQFTIQGAVRNVGEFEYDESKNLRVLDAIFMAGGKKSDAGNIAMIYRRDPLVPNSMEYLKVNLQDIEANPNSDQNIVLQGFDIVELMSRNQFEEEQFISIQGAVNKPGDFSYGKNMTVADALILGHGLKLGAATNNIEVSRLVFMDNKPTKTVVARLNIDSNYQFDENSEANYALEPYDNIYIRFVPEFEFQKEVVLDGEVKFPGTYSILSANETILDVVERAGGLTDEAFADGAKLYRAEDSLGFIVLRLEEVMTNRMSKYNYILKNQDVISVPKKQDFVTISGSTRVHEVLDSTIIGVNNEIQVAYHEGKNALFYIDYYAGGLDTEAKKNLIFVKHPNGEVKKTRNRFPFGFRYPEVKRGSHIKVRSKSDLEQMKDDEQADVNWTKVLGDSVAQAMSILTLILLIQRLD